MRSLFVFLVLIVFISLFYNPKHESIIRQKTKDFYKQLKQNSLQNISAIMHITKPLKSSSKSAYISNLDWLNALSHQGKWSLLKKLVGEMETQRLAKKFNVRAKSIYALGYQGNYIAFYYFATEKQWKILSCRPFWNQKNLYVNWQGQKMPFLGLENGYIWLAQAEKNIKIPLVATPKSHKEVSSLKKLVLNIGYQTPSEDPKINWELTLSNSQKKFIAKSGDMVPMGDYTYSLKAPGFLTAIGKLELNKKQTEFLLQKKLAPAPRPLEIHCYDKKQKVIPDAVFIAEQKAGAEIYPGTYTLSVKKKGYKSISKKIEIKASAVPFKLNLHLEKATYQVEIVFKNPDGKTILPKKFFIDGKQSKDFLVDFTPGEHLILAKFALYQDIKKRLKIVKSQKWEIPLKKRNFCRVVVKVNYNEKHEKKVIPTIFLKSVDNPQEKIEVKGETLVDTGSYYLEINCNGYKSYNSTIKIPSQKRPFYIRTTLKASARICRFHISADYPAAKEINPDQILLNNTPLGKTIYPGKYVLEIYKTGYIPIKREIQVPAATSPFVIAYIMSSQKRSMRLTFLSKKSRKPIVPSRILLSGKNITNISNLAVKPGRYSLMVSVQGHYDLKEQIEIPIGVGVYNLTFFMVVKNVIVANQKRSLAFEFTSEDGSSVKPREVFVDGKPYNFYRKKAEFLVGTSLDIEVKFLRFANYRQKVKIVSGTAPIVIKAILPKLEQFFISFPKKALPLDGVSYNYAFFYDKMPLEGLLVQALDRGRECQFILSIPKTTKMLKVQAGYLFLELECAKAQLGTFGSKSHLDAVATSQIDIALWKEHFVNLRDQKGMGFALESLEAFLINGNLKDKLQKSTAAYAKLTDYFASWQATTAKEKAQHKNIILLLKNLGK